MLDSEPTNETDTNEAGSAGTATPPIPPAPAAPAAPAPVAPPVPAAVFQAPQVLFQPPTPPAPSATPGRDDGDAEPDADGGRPSRRTRGGRGTAGTATAGTATDGAATDGADEDSDAATGRSSRRSRRTRSSRVRDTAPDDLFGAASVDAAGVLAEADSDDAEASGGARTSDDEAETEGVPARRRRRRNRTRRSGEAAASDDDAAGAEDRGSDEAYADDDAAGSAQADDSLTEAGAGPRRRRRKRRRGSADGDLLSPDDPPDTVVHVREPHNPADDVRTIKGSTRLEAKKQRRREGRESGRRRPPVVTESEFLARRESVERTMVVRQRGDRTQIAVLEDGVLVEHYVNRTTHASYVGNVYLGKVQNVLPSMEAAFVDIGKGRNAVLYAGEVNFDASGLEGQPKRIESALKAGQSVIVQVTKDPVGHKGARLTSQISLPGRYLVYVPGASMTGISRKLPDTERNRLKHILKKVTPENAGVIVRTAAEGAAEAELDRDITRLAAQWETIEKKSKTANAPALLYGEPDLTIRVVRDVFNEDFSKLIVSGDEGWETIDEYVRYVAPHLADRLTRWDGDTDPDSGDDVFAAYRIDEQLAKALERKVWLPSGGSLVIDRTEAMTVIDVNTGKFTGQGGNLEETVTRNNLEAAEEIVRQLRLRDVGGIVVIDFIDMVLESNRELVLRRLLECLARDRTKHQVAEVTSLGLVQMTRKRVGAGLLEAFSQQCECCSGRGVIVTLDAPAEPAHRSSAGTVKRPVPAPPTPGNGKSGPNGRNGGRAVPGPVLTAPEINTAESISPNGPVAAPAPDTAATATPATSDNGDNVGSGGNRSSGSGNGGSSGSSSGSGSAANGGDDASAANEASGSNDASGSGGSAASAANGARRTRRPTNGGTAFATVVHVEDSPALTYVVPAAPPVPETSQADSPAFAPVVTDPDAAPVRRTRAGSAVARVTVVTPPEPPAAEPAPEQEQPAPESDAPAPEAATPDTATPEAVAPETVEPETVEPGTVAPETVAPVEVEPEAAEPETVAPEADVPETAAPEAFVSEPAAPEADVPETTAPDTLAPGTAADAEPPVAAATAVESPVEEVITAEPEAATPEADAPDALVPEAVAPEAVPDAEPPAVEEVAAGTDTAAPEAPADVVETVAPEADAPESVAAETDVPEEAAPEAVKPDAIADSEPPAADEPAADVPADAEAEGEA